MTESPVKFGFGHSITRQEDAALICDLPRGLGELPYTLKLEGSMTGFGS